MPCVRANQCSFAAQVQAGRRLLRVLRHLYCDLDTTRCARIKMGASDAELPPDLMPNGYSLSELAEPGL
jgi:hypothetical protein